MPCLIEGVGAIAAAIFSSAEARARGLRVSSAPEASARYSRCRETASETICAMIGASTIDSTQRTTKRMPRPPAVPGRSPPAAAERQPAAAPVGDQEDGPGQRRDDRHQPDVVVLDVRHLVGNDSLELVAVERVEEPARDRDRGLFGPVPVANALGSESGIT